MNANATNAKMEDGMKYVRDENGRIGEMMNKIIKIILLRCARARCNGIVSTKVKTEELFASEMMQRYWMDVWAKDDERQKKRVRRWRHRPSEDAVVVV